MPNFSAEFARPRPWWIAGLLLAAAPALLLLRVLISATTNAPATDDYISLLPFLCDWAEKTSAAEHWRLLTEQFIGHRLIFTKLLTLLDHAMLGELNLSALQAVGWAGWFAVLAGLVATVPAVRRAPWLALPVSLLLMHPEGTSNLLAAIGMGNLWVVAFAFFSLILAFVPRSGPFVLSLLLAAAAAGSFANGLMVFPAACCSLALCRRWQRALIFGAVGAGIWCVYLHGYQSSMGGLSLPELFRKAAIMAGGWCMLGRTPEPVSLFTGCALLAIAALGLLACRRLWQELPGHAAFIVFIFLTIFMAARGRAGWDDYYMLQDRYRLYGLLLIATGYLVCIQLVEARRAATAFVGIGIGGIYCVLAYANFLSPTLTARNLYQATATNAQIGQCFPCSIPKDWPVACASLDRAAAVQAYHLPLLLGADDLALVHSLQTTPRSASQQFYLQANEAIEGHYLMPPDSARLLPIPEIAVLAGADRLIILPVEIFRIRLAEILPRLSVQGNRFGLRLPSPVYRAGPHAIYGLARDSRGKLQIIFAGSATLP